MYQLFGRPGWGSALTELQLGWYGLSYRLEEVDEGLIFRSGMDAHRREVIDGYGVDGARKFGQILNDPSHDRGGRAIPLGGPDVEPAVLKVGDG